LGIKNHLKAVYKTPIENKVGMSYQKRKSYMISSTKFSSCSRWN